MEVMKDYSQYRLADIQNNLNRAGFYPLDVMVTGVTGAGKSTTLNTLFQKKVAAVGEGVDPETMEVSKHSLSNYFRIWDTPGLGDNVEKDCIHKEKIINLLKKTWEAKEQTYGFIDMVIVLVEGSKRDMGTTYTLLNEAIVPYIQCDRILVAINQSDTSMKGKHWDLVTRQPDADLLRFLNEQALSIQSRIWKATGVHIYLPVFYSAKYDYNVNKLLDFIIDHMPTERRKI